ncbi:MAG TPA: tetratricopeptide repeat protein [Rudaea sp.]|nr:tetratricopeptide repeat protein [Rudaea sp.]
MPSVLAELKRRKVYQAAAFYAAAAWLLVQIATQVLPFFELPNGWVRLIVVVAIAGFPIAITLAWFYEWTPAGFRRESEAERTESISRIVGEALDRKVFTPRKFATLSPQANDQSIAVLPFVDMSEKKDHEYFSDGLAEELLNLLAQLPQLRVIARTSSFSFKGKDVDIATIATALNVASILEGSVRRAGNTLRVTAQLIRTTDSSHLWSQTYERELADVFAVQDDIAHAVVAALKVKLLPEQHVPNVLRTESTEAYDLYLLGQDFFRRGRYDDCLRALPVFQRALELDPQYAPAYAGLAGAQSAAADFALSPARRASGKHEALASAEKAISLAPDLADGYVMRGQIRYRHIWDWKGAEADYQRALTLDPNRSDALTGYALAQANLGRSEEALALARRATDADPLSWLAWTFYGLVLHNIGRIAEARAAFVHALEISPNATFTRLGLGLLDLHDGDAKSALEHFRCAGEGYAQAGIAMAEHTLGHARESQAALDELKAKYVAGFSFQIAQVHAWRGEKDDALEWLERAYEQHDPGILRLRSDPQLWLLQDDPRYVALIQNLNYPD